MPTTNLANFGFAPDGGVAVLNVAGARREQRTTWPAPFVR